MDPEKGVFRSSQSVVPVAGLTDSSSAHRHRTMRTPKEMTTLGFVCKYEKSKEAHVVWQTVVAQTNRVQERNHCYSRVSVPGAR